MPYYHMMNWFPFTGFWVMMVAWLIALAIAYLVYKDAEKRGMNGLLWGLPILIRWIGALFLVLYLIMRDGGHHLAGTEKAKAMPGRYSERKIRQRRADKRGLSADEGRHGKAGQRSAKAREAKRIKLAFENPKQP